MQLEKLTFYVSTLAVPARRGMEDLEVQRGAKLFDLFGLPCGTQEKWQSPYYWAGFVLLGPE